jgi:nucleotide-binding universal stress UspA family protein
METKTFIVPHDFTAVADNALNHAIATAKPLDAQIYVVHVVQKEKNINEAEAKLKGILATKDSSVKLIPSVRVGNIFDDIGDFAAEHHAELIFMGTHGATGWQHVTGSNALKIVTNSDVPFIIVQEKGIKPNGYDDIVVPLDLNKETKQKLAVVANLATYFKSRVHVITPNETDEFLRKKVQANILFANRFFSERGIEVTTTLAPKSNFEKEVLKHSVTLEADLIAIMNLNRNNLLGAIGTNSEQYIISNEAQIPTLIMNPIDSPYGGSVMFGGG